MTVIKKYVLYNNELNIENIIDIADTEDEIRDCYKMAKIFKRMVGQEDLLQMALVELSDEELEMINQ